MASRIVNGNRTFTFEWRIENFSYISINKEEFVSSPRFKVFGSNNSSSIWRVNIVQNTENLDVWLINDKDDSNILCDWEFSFLDQNAEPIFISERVKNYNFKNTPTRDIPLGPRQEDVFVTKRSEYLPKDAATLLLRLWLFDEYMPLNDEYCHSCTVIGRDRSKIIWNIEDFISLFIGDEVTKTLHFAYSDNICIISMSLVGLSLESASVRFKLDLDSKLNISCKISVLDIEKKSVKSQDYYYQFTKRDDNLVSILPTFLTRQEILENGTQWLQKDALSLLLEFEINVFPHVGTIYSIPAYMKKTIANINQTAPSESSVPKLEDKTDHSNTSHQKEDPIMILMKDFLLLYREQKLCDFELRSRDASFPVHKVVLSARSPFFSNLFSNHMENDPSYHVVPDLNSSTMDIMLTFLYGGTLDPDLTWEDASKLYSAAVKYQIQSLKEKCSIILKSGISMSNACDFLILANKHGDAESTSFVEDFLFGNVDELINSPQWKEFNEQNEQLGIITMQNILKLSSIKKQHLVS